MAHSFPTRRSSGLRSDSWDRCNSCGYLLVSRCWLAKRHGSVTPRLSANTSPASIKPSLTKRQETNGSRRFPQPKSIHRVEEPYIAAGTVSSFSQQGLPVAIEWALARFEERGAMRALWTKFGDRAGEARDTWMPIGRGAAVE